jgi:hypothetical protein
MTMKSTIFSNVMLYSVVEVQQHFRGTYCLSHQGKRLSITLLVLFTL